MPELTNDLPVFLTWPGHRHLHGISSPKLSTSSKAPCARPREVLNTDVRTLFVPGRQIDDAFLAELEEKFLQADMGVENVEQIIAAVRDRWRLGKIKNAAGRRGGRPRADAGQLAARRDRELNFAATGPTVILVAGINGAGKTTSIAKLAWLLKEPDEQEGDGLRQRHLPRRGRRSTVHLGRADRRGDRQAQDGRRPRRRRLRRLRSRQVARHGCADRRYRRPTAHAGPSDARADQNPRCGRQAHRRARRTKCCWCSMPPPARTPSCRPRIFGKAINVTGIILAKLDGTAKGGVVIAIKEQLNIPVKFIGLGRNAAGYRDVRSAAVY